VWMRTFACLLAVGVPVFSFQDGKAPTGTIAGKVVSQATGTPLVDAIVKLHYANPAGADEIMVQQTNEGGRFSFAGLWGIEWELSAECHGFAPATYRATKYNPHGRFSLERNQQMTDIVLKLAGQSVVTGRVTDTDGAPVEDARVTLLKAGYTGGVRHWSEIASAESLDNGEYRIPRVVAGLYLVRASIPKPDVERMASAGVGEIGRAATYYPKTTDQSLAAPVDVAGGAEIRGIDIQFVPIRVFHIRGKLHQTDFRSVSAWVMLADRSDPAQIIASIKSLSPESTFDFARVPPGSYVIYAGLNVTPGVYTASQSVTVAGSDIDGLLLNLVHMNEVSGVLKLKSDNPPVDLRKVRVTVPQFQAGMAPSGATWGPLKIADDLTFSQAPGLIPNSVGFTVTVSDLPEGCYVASILYGGRKLPEQGIEYSADATLTITIGADGGRIDGTAIGKDDQPFGGAVIALFSADGKDYLRSLQADPQGAFHFKGIPPGDYTVIAWDDVSRDDLENPQFVKQFDSEATPISLAARGSATASIKIVGR
jgi:carboxypeptidase family protein